MRKVGRTTGILLAAAGVAVAFMQGSQVTAALAPVAYPGKRLAGHSILPNPDGSWTHIRVQNIAGDVELSKQRSTDDGLTWSSFTRLADIPDTSIGTLLSTQYDASGEIQVHLVRPRGSGTPNAGFYLDLWHMRSSNNQTTWSPLTLQFPGYLPDLKQQTLLSNGRLVMPFFTFTSRPYGPPTGTSDSRVMFSDDRGATWKLSTSILRTPTPGPYEFNGDTTGGVEPIVIDQPDHGRQLMLIRTQADYLYQSYSFNNGTTWSNPEPSIFASSDSPGDYERLPDGRLMMFWNNTRNSPRYNGEGVYSGRDAVHAAISSDDGLTWQGFREIYLDPTRHATPPSTNDRGVGIPSSIMMSDNRRVGVMTGQGPGSVLLHVDPEWLYEKSQRSDFSNGLDGWSAFTGVGPASGYFRDRVVGPDIITDPAQAGNKLLHLNNPDGREVDGDGATWNFTMGTQGTLTMRMKMSATAKVADIQLTDRFLDPTDDTSSNVSIFNLRFNDRGEVVGQEQLKISKDVWHEVAIGWDMHAKQASLQINGQQVGTLPMRYESPTGVSYLRLRSPFVSALDPGGWLVDWVDVQIDDTSMVPKPRTIAVASGTQTQGQAGYPKLSYSLPVVKTGLGTVVLDQANTLTGSTTVQAGVLRVANASALVSSHLAVAAGGTAQIAPYVRATVAGLALSGTGLVDVTNGGLTVAAGLSSTDLVARLVGGRNGGNWDGVTGITSTVTAAQVAAGDLRAVGWLDNGDGSLSVAYSAPGDTNLDWVVDILDAANFVASGKYGIADPATWSEGDFNYDGVFDIQDIADFAATGLYGRTTYNAASGLAAVPEPAVPTALLVSSAAAALAFRAKHRKVTPRGRAA